MTQSFDLLRPWETLDPWQKDYIFNTDPNQNCFLLCGRQVGKTAGASIKSVELCINKFKKGDIVLVNSITEKQAYRIMARAEAYARIKYPHMIATGKDKPTQHKLRFKNGTGIDCYAAGEKGEGLRGDTIKKLIVDEASRMSDDYWISVLPMLSVSGGSVDALSTPAGKVGYFFKFSEDPSFKKFYVSAEDCPRHTKEFLSAQKMQMTRLQYSQEYLALFLDDLKQKFSDELIAKCCIINRENDFRGDKNYLGIDVGGMGDDESAFVSLSKYSKDFMRQIDQETTERTYLTDTINRALILHEKHHYKKIYVDDQGIGFGLFSALLADFKTSRRVVSINNSARPLIRDESRKKKILKEDLYNNLLVLMEQGKIHLYKDRDLMLSLKSVQEELTDEGRVKIFSKDGHLAEALVRAAWGSKEKSLNPWAR